MQKYYQFFIILTFLFLTGCANQITRVALNNQNKANIQSTQMLLNSTQREIVMKQNNIFSSTQPDPYMPMDSGAIVTHNRSEIYNGIYANNLIVELINSGIQHYKVNKAMTALAPVRNSLADFNFMNYFNSELQNSVAKISWLGVKKQEIKYDLQKNREEIVASANENTTLLIGTTYALNSTFKQLEVIAYVELIQKDPVKKYRILYANNFFFVDRLPIPNNNTEENKVRWIANNGMMLKEKLHNAAKLLSEMIAIDMKNTNVYATNQLIFVPHKDGFKAKANLIKKEDGYSIALMNTKEIYVVNENAING